MSGSGRSTFMVRAVALDLDGTLCDSDGNVGDVTVAALTRFVREGGRCIIATGRGIDFSTVIAKGLRERGLEIDGLVVSDGGLVLGKNSNSKNSSWDQQYHCSMPCGKSLAPIVEQISREMPAASFAADMDGEILISSSNYFDLVREHNLYFFNKMLSDKKPMPLDFMPRLEASMRIAWMRVLHPTISTEQLRTRVNEIVELHHQKATLESETRVPLDVASSTLRLGPTGAITVRSVDNDKRVGLAVIAKEWGLDPQEFLAFGDAQNDLGMFRWAGKSVCPANALDCAKSLATEISPLTNNEGFIADTLRRNCGWEALVD